MKKLMLVLALLLGAGMASNVFALGTGTGVELVDTEEVGDEDEDNE